MLSSRTDLLKKAASNINQYSPLIIQGEAGVGKSFFLESLCRELCSNGTIKEYKIRNSWDFMNEMIYALCDKDIHIWRQEWLCSGVIAIRNFQFLQDKTATLRELYQILKSVNAPIIITTTMPISNDHIFCEDLVVFLNQGTRIILNPPAQTDIENYLKCLLQDSNIALTEQAHDWLANQNIDSFAVAKGIVKTLHLHQETNTPIGVSDCIAIIQPLLISANK